jgi:hypothetical protein
MTNPLVCTTFLLLLLSGCACITNSISDSIECHHKCPGDSPEAEKKCHDECRRQLAAKREQDREASKKAEEDRQEYEWKEKTGTQMRTLEKSYPPLIK